MTLVCKNLACRRGDNLVFSRVSFKVALGDLCLVTGPNGAGKSSLLRLMAGFLRAEEGSIHFEHKNITIDNENRSNQFLYLGHKNGVKKHLTVLEQINFWEGLTENSYDSATDPLGINDILNKKLYECSAGQCRKVALCRLDIEGKKIWLLDEPTTSLDQNAIKAFELALKKHLSKNGLAIVATHQKLRVKNKSEIKLNLSQSYPLTNDPFL